MFEFTRSSFQRSLDLYIRAMNRTSLYTTNRLRCGLAQILVEENGHGRSKSETPSIPYTVLDLVLIPMVLNVRNFLGVLWVESYSVQWCRPVESFRYIDP